MILGVRATAIGHAKRQGWMRTDRGWSFQTIDCLFWGRLNIIVALLSCAAFYLGFGWWARSVGW